MLLLVRLPMLLQQQLLMALPLLLPCLLPAYCTRLDV
jgi:hypothetical protein